MINIEELFSVTCLAALAIISPGPSYIAITKNSLCKGRQSGIATAIGIAFGDLTHALVNLFGFSLLLMQFPKAFNLLKYIGAAYLLYLGLINLISKLDDLQNHDVTKCTPAPKKDFLFGYGVVILNPKAWLFFLSLFTVIVSENTSMPGRLFYCVWISFISFSWFSGLAVFLTNNSFHQKIKPYLIEATRLTGIILIFFAIKLLNFTH